LPELFCSSFILDQPKDIVSGDFYWCHENERYKIVAVADCTGHGVPGAFMSIIGASFLKEIVVNNNIYMPDEILNVLRLNVVSSLKQPKTKSSGNYDGMDVSIVTVDLQEKVMYYAGANNSICVINDRILTKYLADLMPIGIWYTDNSFTRNTIPIANSCKVYMYSDGYADQFYHTGAKKFSWKRLEKMLLRTQHLGMHQQGIALKMYMNNVWKKNRIQTDDIMLIGFNVNSGYL
jgi:serine phosphatase RsbU (regulator of sigma subunit)